MVKHVLCVEKVPGGNVWTLMWKSRSPEILELLLDHSDVLRIRLLMFIFVASMGTRRV